MYLSLLELTYAVEDRATVEAWLAREHLGGVLISVERYDDEMLAVLASHQGQAEARLQLQRHPAISSVEEKRRTVYRVTTAIPPRLLLRSFPGENSEWYTGGEQTVYLSTQARYFSDEQIAWLVACTHIVNWEYQFDLSPQLVGC